MNFLAPLFLLGALAITLPILFHLMRRQSRERKQFSTLMFLEATPPRVKQRSRLDHLFLLILRCLVLGLVAAAFARPYLPRAASPTPVAGDGVRQILLLDTSASMRRGDLWPQAQKKALERLRGARPNDQVALWTFDNQVQRRVTFEAWSAMAVSERASVIGQRLRDIKPSYAATRLDDALISAGQALEEAARGNATFRPQIILISDLQEGARLDNLQGQDWPKGLEVVLETVAVKDQGNAGLQAVLERDLSVKPAGQPDWRVRVSNSAGAKKEKFTLQWGLPGEPLRAGQPTEIYVPAGQSRIVPAPRLETQAAGVQVALAGDTESFDNALFHIVPGPVRTKVVYIGNHAESDPAQPLYYLRRALQPTSRRQFEITRQTPEAVGEVPAEQGTFVMLAEPVPAERAAALRKWLTNGGAMLVMLRDPGMASSLAGIAGMEPLACEEAGAGQDALIAEIDFSHPVFAAFADPRFSDFTKIHFWRHRRIKPEAIPGARVVVRHDRGGPLILEAGVEHGRLFVLTSGWHPADSQLALSSKFVPLIHGLLDYGAGVNPRPQNYLVGEVVTIPADLRRKSGERFLVRKPDGATVTLDADAQFRETDLPGVYTCEAEGAAFRFAVNIDPGESKTLARGSEELARFGVPLAANSNPQFIQAAATPARLHAENLESRQKLWRWLIAGALGVALVETWWAGRRRAAE